MLPLQGERASLQLQAIQMRGLLGIISNLRLAKAKAAQGEAQSARIGDFRCSSKICRRRSKGTRISRISITRPPLITGTGLLLVGAAAEDPPHLISLK